MEPRQLILSSSLSEEDVRGILAPFGFQDPLRADHCIQQLTDRIGDPERLAERLDSLLTAIGGTADPDSALLNFESFVENVPSPLNLLSLLQANPQALENLMGLMGASPFLTQILVRNPEYFYWLLEKGRLQAAYDAQYFKAEAEKAVAPFTDPGRALDALRRLRRRESLRIGAQDILGYTKMGQTVTQVSWLADAILHKAFEILAAGRLQPEDGFAVFGLGKLGGEELNFSSDVDLIFVYSDTADSQRIIRFAREYLKRLTEYSPEGHLYRVDLRLRPMGGRGEIAYSEKACRQYYQTWADTTDRLALIKVRPVAGDPELGRRFAEWIQDFVFKKYLDYAAVEEIRWIKKLTDQKLDRRNESERNVKLGLGGIREIEFFVQSFQILYGGNSPGLRTGNSQRGLDLLVDAGLIRFEEYDQLSRAYTFLRNLEHKLQLVHDVQTHNLPEEDEELLLCARRMGYRAPADADRLGPLTHFRRDLQAHSKNVRRIFNSLFEDATSERGLEELVLNPAITDEEALIRLSARGVREASGLLEGIRMLQQAPSFPHSPTRLRNLLANLTPRLAEVLKDSADPRDCISRFDSFCEALGTRASLYSELIENAPFFERLLSLFSHSPFLSDILIRNTEMLDAVPGPSLSLPYAATLPAFLKRKEAQGMSFADGLRLFKRREEFKIGVGQFFDPRNFSYRLYLTEMAEAALEETCRSLVRRHPGLDGQPFSILALGKMGGRELMLQSDLDLLLVFDDSNTNASPADLGRFARALRAELHEYTAEGRAYEIDFRLRPEGRHSTEAIPLSQLFHHFQKRSEAWERLAYVKLRSLVEFGLKVPIAALLFGSHFSEEERGELRRIRMRKEQEIGREDLNGVFDFKVGMGGLLDIQFLVQYLQVEHHIEEQSTAEALTALEKGGFLGKDAVEILRAALALYFSIEAAGDLVGLSPRGKIPRIGGLAAERLADLLGYASFEEFLREYERTTRAVRPIFDSIFLP